MHIMDQIELALDDNRKKKRQNRYNYTILQIRILKSIFEDTQYPTQYDILEISKSLGIPTDKISIWFQNKRSRSPKSAGIMKMKRSQEQSKGRGKKKLTRTILEKLNRIHPRQIPYSNPRDCAIRQRSLLCQENSPALVNSAGELWNNFATDPRISTYIGFSTERSQKACTGYHTTLQPESCSNKSGYLDHFYNEPECSLSAVYYRIWDNQSGSSDHQSSKGDMPEKPFVYHVVENFASSDVENDFFQPSIVGKRGINMEVTDAEQFR